ncbi:LysE family translocator [Sulfitobacter sp. LCG007]
MTVSLTDLLLYSGALLVLFLTPGPVWLAITARALSGGFAAAWPLALGVSVGDILWPLVAVLGINWILSVFDTFMAVMRWIACGVFLVMGLQLVRHASERISADSRLTRPGRGAGFAAGVLAILGNPKAVLFYIGVLPGFFDLRVVSPGDVAAIIVCSVAIPLAGNLVVAALVGHFRSAVTGGTALRRINILCGMLLVAVGLLIPLL